MSVCVIVEVFVEGGVVRIINETDRPYYHQYRYTPKVFDAGSKIRGCGT